MFQINNIWWHIYFVPATSHCLLRSDGRYTVGMCDNDERSIYICDTLYGEFLRKVICHEITHAAMFSYDIVLTIEQEEVLADIIATYGNEIIDITNTFFKKLKG